MKQLGIFTFSSIAALLILPGSSIAQEKTLKDQLVGSWMLVSCAPPANGDHTQYCARPNGSLNFDAGGRFMFVLTATGRPKTTGASGPIIRANVTPEEYKAVAEGVAAQFGTYTVNEADKTVTRHIEAAFFPRNEGTDVKSTVSITGDQMKNTGRDGGVTTWRRAK